VGKRLYTSMGVWSEKSFGNNWEISSKAHDARLLVSWLADETALATCLTDCCKSLAYAVAAWANSLDEFPALLAPHQAQVVRTQAAEWQALFVLCRRTAHDRGLDTYWITPKFHYIEHVMLDMVEAPCM
jgi:hypothetical protein